MPQNLPVEQGHLARQDHSLAGCIEEPTCGFLFLQQIVADKAKSGGERQKWLKTNTAVTMTSRLIIWIKDPTVTLWKVETRSDDY
ncbi:MAG: hypothetical protein ACRDSH_09205, partial [Pseudonocardiaceae bacterium]